MKYRIDRERYKYVHEDNNETPHKVFKIEALKDFGDVKKGDFGGWIESESNLSQYGDCWVYGDAIVYGKARVSDNARILLNAKVCDNARVNNNAIVDDCAAVKGGAHIYGNAIVRYHSLVDDHATVGDYAIVDDYALVSEYAKVGDRAIVSGHAEARSSAVVEGTAKLKDNAIVNNSAYVCGGEISGFAAISEKSVVEGNPIICDRVGICGRAKISGDATIKGSVCVTGFSIVKGSATLAGNVTITGSTCISDKVNMEGSAVFITDSVLKDNVTIKPSCSCLINNCRISDNVTIDGNLTIDDCDIHDRVTFTETNVIGGPYVINGYIKLKNMSRDSDCTQKAKLLSAKARRPESLDIMFDDMLTDIPVLNEVLGLHNTAVCESDNDTTKPAVGLGKPTLKNPYRDKSWYPLFEKLYYTTCKELHGSVIGVRQRFNNVKVTTRQSNSGWPLHDLQTTMVISPIRDGREYSITFLIEGEEMGEQFNEIDPMFVSAGCTEDSIMKKVAKELEGYDFKD